MNEVIAADLTDIVLERYSRTPDPRLREILSSLIRHLHDFARDVNLTEDEWMVGIDFLTRTGQKCDDKRQEMILLSDNLGLSALVNTISANVPAGATETTVLGPFYVPSTPERQWGESVLLRPLGDDIPLIVHGRVLGPDGEHIPDATIEIWQTDSNGMYDIQDPDQPENNLRGHYRSRDDGQFLITSIRPTSYPIPVDGPVGELLNVTARHPWRPAHIHAVITAKGYNSLTTHLFDAEDEYLKEDVVFAVKESLIRAFTRIEDPAEAAKWGTTAPFWFLENDFHLTKAR
ncbi:dioxygenase [Paracoccus shandongensis]|uniref:dioxygenase family protein n=1 Tax=Paracoccus shandongensis TaxID=2816048 RepID=UPI001A908DB4|nr:dioxygenase [Paracoccus shandongensis]